MNVVISPDQGAGLASDPRLAQAEQSLLSRVIALRDGTEDAFLATGAELVEIAALLDDARRAAVLIHDLAQTDLLNRLRAEADRQATCFAALSAEFSDTGSGIRKLTAELAGLHLDLDAVSRSVVTMRCVVLNARVTLASLRMQDMNLLNFAESGQTVVAEIADLLMQFEETMAGILKAVDLTDKMVGRIDTTLHTEVLSAFASLMNDLIGFEAGARAVSGRGEGLSRRLQSLIEATSRAVSGLQVGDTTRQRLDHISYILALPNAENPALSALADELLRDAALGHSRMLDQLQASVAEMIAGIRDLVEGHLANFFGSSGQTVDAAVLVSDSARLAEAIAALHPMQEQTGALGRSMAEEFEAFRSLISKGEGVQDSTHLIGINAVLSCMRLGQEGTALKVVAEQLQVVSHEVGARFATIRDALTRVSTMGDNITTGTGRLVQQSIQVPEQLIGSVGPMIQKVVEHLGPAQQAVARLKEGLSTLSFDFGPAMGHRRRLEELADLRPGRSGAVSSDGIADTTLATIFSMFTMEAERDAFRAVLPDRIDIAMRAEAPDTSTDFDESFFL